MVNRVLNAAPHHANRETAMDRPPSLQELILRLHGFRITEIEVNHRPRTTGKSKYGIGNRIWRGIADCFAIRWYRKRVVPAHRTAREGA